MMTEVGVKEHFTMLCKRLSGVTLSDSYVYRIRISLNIAVLVEHA